MPHVVSQAQLGGQRRGQLPAEATGFVGRTKELGGIIALLRLARLVTATGPAGVGKTRLARRAAADAATRFTDGAWFIDLSGLRDPALPASAVAAALGLPERDDAQAQHAAVVGHLRDRRLLLILDTCEHLVDACAAFADTVLRSAPGVTLLATSRQPLDVPGEHTYPVPPMPVPDAPPPGDCAVDGDAVELFAQRAAAVLPGFAVTPDNRADVVRLCRRLDGIPLAIELAAVRLRALPLAELANRVDQGYQLTASRRGTTERHQTLRAAVEWSYRLCTPREQALWARLSVFHETFDVAAAEQVCADESLPADAVVEALIGLVDKSVVLRDPVANSGYRLTGALRGFGAEKLTEAGLRAQFADRLTAWHPAQGSERGEHFRDHAQVAVHHKARREQVRVRAADEYDLTPATGGPAQSQPPGAACLTRRELEIADMVGSGLSNREIASRLVISKRTVDAHVEHIFGKLEISSRVQLTVWLQDHGQAFMSFGQRPS